MESGTTDRLHSLDAVRSLALLLGIVLHGAMPWINFPGWPVVEPRSTVLTLVVSFIHSFRMPVFFLIAGFFGHMMLSRVGVQEFIRDRAKRILLPLVAGILIVLPVLVPAALALGSLVTGKSAPPLPVPPAADGSFTFTFAYFWFLYYLILFYVTALLARSSIRTRRILDALVRLIMRPAGVLLPAAALAACAYLGKWFGLPAPGALQPDLPAFFGFGLFFGLGWLLHRQPPLLLALRHRWPGYCVLAVAAMFATSAITRDMMATGQPPLRLQALGIAVTAALTTCCWVWGLTGAAIRFLSGVSPVRRYLADASYWMYLMHVPVLLFFSVVLHPRHLHWTVKYPLTLASALMVLLLTYHYLVRATFIGAILNGRRRPREPISQLPRTIRANGRSSARTASGR